MVAAALRIASRAGLPPALACTVLISSLLHAALMVVPLPSGPGRGNVPTSLPVLQARLTPAPGEADNLARSLPDRSEVPAQLEMPRLQPLEPALLPTAVTTPAVLADTTPAPERVATSGDAGDGLVSAEPLVDMSRLGDLLGRAQTDFPAEVSFPVRVNGQIRVRYPPEAVAQGVEGSVVAWVIVDPTGNVEQVEFAEGDPVFRDAVSEAIRSGQYYPAASGGVGLRFHIALEFRFALGDLATTQTAATTAH